ncbi:MULTISPECIES: gamma-glutamyl-gamma-aminobutyrate hydrolase family protein [Streptomyces]|jgi:putative glutamine amidotransferase|uniref:Gamma-glutamyl-gamma-aminobutyrate hydrolase family protein n=1 Tax=Streptomyces caniscabiei TaxID=2746961 RepID=A0ABU4N2X0_9ACTN|nr:MULTISPECIES: gamma-glutamyl-gamma-aminobutyrate hydrolase family protein [Streptomyces]MDX2948326.1 gamma-glutamyl-gamma-aminobutyrate hydrolase family protein [Streptomyces caniscabiei]MDX2957600.1 gamma-glutamyl-gamma-aminobutyrate hydrolase family protein [Streptomyces caniscabiei]MDX2991010.1 gamma-glutamyl-gamma-aminobutyrate hydrolase family protein [Streptomyces caniscabiei]MDX3015550.1 gamma-glutamyl-gamma-aminobutyrate hydrolase family protein [Streptomyces caniscabiei]MDX3043197.
MSGPVVAVTADTSVLSWTIWKDVPSAVLPLAYLEKVTGAGGSPLLVPPLPDAVEDVMGRVDALLMSGGQDIDPARYGAVPGPYALPSDPVRDEAELRALAVAERRGIPVLAICRGLQLVSISRGGTLHEHHPEHSPKVPGHYDRRAVRLAPDSLAGSVMGASASVYCHHHQSVDVLGAGLVATGWAEDGLVEVVEDPSARFMVGLQAHAELGEDTRPLFRAFVDAAR